MSIEPGDVIPRLLEACPSFGPVFALVKDEHLDDAVPGGRLLYLDAAEFLRHIASLQLARTTAEFDAIFDTIELFVVEGDDYVSNLGVIGFLEGLQMTTVTSLGIDPDQTFRPWFRPVTAAWWRRINRFWAGEHDALRVSSEQIQAEAHQGPPPHER